MMASWDSTTIKRSGRVVDDVLETALPTQNMLAPGFKRGAT
jgi:hypothetical protein